MMARIFSGVTTDRTSGLPTDYHDHFLHCIDYLRQAVMCTADLALEAHDINDADDLGPLDGGWSGHHGTFFCTFQSDDDRTDHSNAVCKDYGEVISYLEGLCLFPPSWPLQLLTVHRANRDWRASRAAYRRLSSNPRTPTPLPLVK